MLENIQNTITRLAMTNWDETWLVASHHVPDMFAVMRLQWQQPLPSNCALHFQQLWVSGGRMRERILMTFRIQQHMRTTMTVTWM